MSRLASAVIAAALMVLAVHYGLAVPLTQTHDVLRYLESDNYVLTDNEHGPLLREKRQFQLNDYQIALYANLAQLKASNCTEDFLNQSVSPYLCDSKWILYTPLKAVVERFGGAHNPMALYTYELCSNVTLFNEKDVILGHDFVIFRRPINGDATLEVFMLQIVNATVPWLELVSHRTIPANTSGWQTFHLESQISPLVEKRACVIMFVRETTLMNESKPLNRSELAERFVLDEASPSEASKKPFTVTFMISNGSLPFAPLFGKRSAEQSSPVGCSISTECMLQSHIVELSSFLGADILYPAEANLGRCDSDWQTADEGNDYYRSVRQETEKAKEDSSPSDLYQCVPTSTDSLLALVIIDGMIVLTTIPDMVITECSTQPCNVMEEDDVFY